MPRKGKGGCYVQTCHALPHAQSSLGARRAPACFQSSTSTLAGLVHLCLDVVAVTTNQTPLCALFGIDAPIVQAPIGSWPELSAAVSNAGGLGILGLSWDDPSEVRRLIRETSNLTARTCPVPHKA